MQLSFFGSSILSSYWNGAATYYRGLLKALAGRGYDITFYEPDAFERQQHRDIEPPPWCRVVVYPGDDRSQLDQHLAEASHSGIVVKASGVGVFDEYLEACIPALRPGQISIFWDVDAPATLDRLSANPADPFHRDIPRYSGILTYGGGQPVIDAYVQRGARFCVPVYNAVDSGTHLPVQPEPRFACDLAFLANRLPDRERRADDFFFAVARQLPDLRFLLGGSGWGDKEMPANVHYVGHVSTEEHNAFNCSASFVLNVNRDSMAAWGFSPATRIFEAAAAGASIITDEWPGIDLFLQPGYEVLIARGTEDVCSFLRHIPKHCVKQVGDAARKRVLAEHTYLQRAAQVDLLLRGLMQQQAPIYEAVAQ